MDFLNEYEKSKWEKDFEEGQYFLNLSNGDSLGFDENREEFSLNNYWNVIDDDEVTKLIKKWGIDL
jgi:hypothetical protein